MRYIDGFVTAVPSARRDAYRRHAAQGWTVLQAAGAGRQGEAWGDDVPHGTHTDFHRAVQATPDETVVFSWIEYADKATRNAAAAQVMAAPEMAALIETMPFDGARMIYGGFEVVVDQGAPSPATGYVDGFLLAARDRDAYVALATRSAPIFLDHGATRVVEAWGDDVPPGTRTSFPLATQREDGESVVFSWIEWPSKAVRDAGMAAAMADPRMKTAPEALPFDGKRMIYGGFTLLFQS